METIRVLLIDTADAVKAMLDKQRLRTDLLKFSVTHVAPKIVEHKMISNEERWHVILFGENTPQANIIQLTKLFRLHGYTIPILMLTKQSEARVPRSLKKLGVDDMLNVAEIGTPLFSWTFMSTLKHAELRKKAEEFDVIRGRLQSADESLANITHEINNPLGVIKLALYHLENPNLESHKKEIFFKLLVANIEKVDIQMKELREVRRRLGDDTTTLAKIFSATSLQGAAEA